MHEFNDVLFSYNCLLLALSPEDIKAFFEPIIKQAEQIVLNFELINPSSEGFNQYRHPVITVSKNFSANCEIDNYWLYRFFLMRLTLHHVSVCYKKL